jgi:ferredoxin-nitrite reductase
MKMASDPAADFSDEQKRYLEGFMSGLQVGRVGRAFAAGGAPSAVSSAASEPNGPHAAANKAQDRVIAAPSGVPACRSRRAQGR